MRDALGYDRFKGVGEPLQLSFAVRRRDRAHPAWRKQDALIQEAEEQLSGFDAVGGGR
jgi:hypothetical protein